MWDFVRDSAHVATWISKSKYHHPFKEATWQPVIYDPFKRSIQFITTVRQTLSQDYRAKLTFWQVKKYFFESYLFSEPFECLWSSVKISPLTMESFRHIQCCQGQFYFSCKYSFWFIPSFWHKFTWSCFDVGKSFILTEHCFRLRYQCFSEGSYCYVNRRFAYLFEGRSLRCMFLIPYTGLFQGSFLDFNYFCYLNICCFIEFYFEFIWNFRRSFDQETGFYYFEVVYFYLILVDNSFEFLDFLFKSRLFYRTLELFYEPIEVFGSYFIRITPHRFNQHIFPAFTNILLPIHFFFVSKYWGPFYL